MTHSPFVQTARSDTVIAIKRGTHEPKLYGLLFDVVGWT